jgi:hypothetical protein
MQGTFRIIRISADANDGRMRAERACGYSVITLMGAVDFSAAVFDHKITAVASARRGVLDQTAVDLGACAC